MYSKIKLTVVTKRRNDLQPPKTICNHLKKINSKDTYNHLKNIYNHPQASKYNLKQPIKQARSQYVKENDIREVNKTTTSP